jgi:hypothetical protein
MMMMMMKIIIIIVVVVVVTVVLVLPVLVIAGEILVRILVENIFPQLITNHQSNVIIVNSKL